MKCQILFSGKNKKNNIILSSAENAQRVVKVNAEAVYCMSKEGPVSLLYKSKKPPCYIKVKNGSPTRETSLLTVKDPCMSNHAIWSGFLH